MGANGPVEIRRRLLDSLTSKQQEVIQSQARRLLVVAGAGSGKTEVMARRVAWWVAAEGVSRDSIVAFTFTEAAAEELKFRIRHHIQRVTPKDDDVTLGGMYVGTIHGFCLRQLRELDPDSYHNFDVIDEGARHALVQRAYHGVLGLKAFAGEVGKGQFQATDEFLLAYDLLNEYDELEVSLPSENAPYKLDAERDWCSKAKLSTKVGTTNVAKAFAKSAARYYAYLRCRRFLDFSTSQSELTRLLRRRPEFLGELRNRISHLVVDEVQDINPVQDSIARLIVGESGHLTAVGDHRQAIYSWRGGRVDIMGRLHDELNAAADGAVLELEDNFRSTERIIRIANNWATTIGRVRGMAIPEMSHGLLGRLDRDASHVALLEPFDNREEEAAWIADAVARLVDGEAEIGALHDTREGDRGISYTDIAVLLRSSTDARVYMHALEQRGIPAVFRAGPDLFSQPEVLLFVGALAEAGGIPSFFGDSGNKKSLPGRIDQALDCVARPREMVAAACTVLRRAGLPISKTAEKRVLLAATLIRERIEGKPAGTPAQRSNLTVQGLVNWLSGSRPLRRVFPQSIFQWLMAEAEVGEWESVRPRGTTAMFHLGQLSSLLKGVETPGWTQPSDFKYQMIALSWWGSANARSAEAPLLVQPDAVTVSTIHGAKGLEFAAVFLADVMGLRFPSNQAKRKPAIPFDGPILRRIDPSDLADNENVDQERRLMYVALTRAERYLSVTCSKGKNSRFRSSLVPMFSAVGACSNVGANGALTNIELRKSEYRRDLRLVTSFSDLRYFLECPHDFYLRKVLGFAPSIDQAFGYGRGVHNLMRAVHSDAKAWAEVAKDDRELEGRLRELIRMGLFYLRYTTGEPADRMRKKAIQLVKQYIGEYASELEELSFEPEREFETLIEEEQVLISGAIDVVRLDDPPRVTLIDFKSGESDQETKEKLDEEEMTLQISLYGLAAKKELLYDPDRGLVRYLDYEPGAHSDKRELVVDLDDPALEQARQKVIDNAREIRQRKFDTGPRKPARDPKKTSRCEECDFGLICGLDAAKKNRGP